jgi:hypothetical protein
MVDGYCAIKRKFDELASELDKADCPIAAAKLASACDAFLAEITDRDMSIFS